MFTATLSLNRRLFTSSSLKCNLSGMVKTRRSRALSDMKGDSDDDADVSRSQRPRKKLKLEPTIDALADEAEYNDTQNLLAESSQTQKSQSESPKKARAKGKGKSKAIDKSAFLPRVDSRWKVGAHVSAAGGVENAVVNAAAIGANAFALFLKSQRKWTSPPMKAESARLFKDRMREFGYESRHVLPHGSYLINLGNPDEEKRKKSYECFIDDLQRCEELGLMFYNFHPGSTVGTATPEESIRHIADCLNSAHKETKSVITVLENMAGAGNIIGSRFQDIAGIIERVEDKSRVAVCFDTCHAFAAGYDIRTKEGWDSTLSQFDSEIGLSYLRGMHLNDSKTVLGSKRDRHENIGLGHLGLSAFQHILTDVRVQDIPLILETPSFEKPGEVWGTELRVLNALSAASVDAVGNGQAAESEKAVGSEKASPGSKAQKADTGSASPSKGPMLEELVKEVKAAVSAADTGKEKAKKSTRGGKKVAKGKKGKKRGEEYEESDEDDDGDDDEDYD